MVTAINVYAVFFEILGLVQNKLQSNFHLFQMIGVKDTQHG